MGSDAVVWLGLACRRWYHSPHESSMIDRVSLELWADTSTFPLTKTNKLLPYRKKVSGYTSSHSVQRSVQPQPSQGVHSTTFPIQQRICKMCLKKSMEATHAYSQDLKVVQWKSAQNTLWGLESHSWRSQKSFGRTRWTYTARYSPNDDLSFYLFWVYNHSSHHEIEASEPFKPGKRFKVNPAIFKF